MSSKQSAPAAEPSFEEAVLRLEAIVANLEGGTLTLEESLAQFEQAVGLSRQCTTRLAAAEKQIQVLTEDGLRPLETPPGDTTRSPSRAAPPRPEDDDPFETGDRDRV